MGYLKMIAPVISEVTNLVAQRQTDGINSSLDAMNGIVLEGVALTGTPTDVWHHLGMRWTQYDILKRSGPGEVYDTGGETDPTKSIQLASSANVTVTIRIR